MSKLVKHQNDEDFERNNRKHRNSKQEKKREKGSNAAKKRERVKILKNIGNVV